VGVKLAIVVRTDLGLGRGKIAAQVAHAAVAAVLASSASADFAAWLADQLQDVVRRAQAARLPVQLVQDAGRTQVPRGTPTCCAIGPAAASRIDMVAGELTLL
jgi:PTH2 family peptidyl-tRNA hydrolase